MKLYILDGESYYDREYNLRRLDPASYILDPRFELIGIAVKEPGTAAYWIEGPDASAFFASLDPNDIMTASHNALFDNCIWSYRYGFVPRLMVDTLGVSRAVLSLKSNSLDSVAEHLGLGAKGEEIHQAIGMRLADLEANPDFYRAYVNYTLNDATLCEGKNASSIWRLVHELAESCSRCDQIEAAHQSDPTARIQDCYR